jgi:hypothetical protein
VELAEFGRDPGPALDRTSDTANNTGVSNTA